MSLLLCVLRIQQYSYTRPMLLYCFIGSMQWLFRKTGTMGTLANQVEIDVWVGRSSERPLLWGSRVSAPGKLFRSYMQKHAIYSAFLAGKWFAKPSIIFVLKHFNNWNAVSTLSPRTDSCCFAKPLSALCLEL